MQRRTQSLWSRAVLTVSAFALLCAVAIARAPSTDEIVFAELPAEARDVLEDRDWLGRHGIVIALSHATGYRREHPHEWATLEDLLREASEFWKERHAGFWIFVA